MFNDYLHPTPKSYENVHHLNIGVGCNNSHFGGTVDLPNHEFHWVFDTHTAENDE